MECVAVRDVHYILDVELGFVEQTLVQEFTKEKICLAVNPVEPIWKKKETNAEGKHRWLDSRLTLSLLGKFSLPPPSEFSIRSLVSHYKPKYF